jgi:hypothetical protein
MTYPELILIEVRFNIVDLGSDLCSIVVGGVSLGQATSYRKITHHIWMSRHFLQRDFHFQVTQVACRGYLNCHCVTSGAVNTGKHLTRCALAKLYQTRKYRRRISLRNK